MNHIPVIAGGLLFASAVTAIMSVALSRSAAPPPPVVAAAEPEPPLITETYREIALSVLRQSAEDAKVVQIEKIIPPIIPMVNVAKALPVENGAEKKKSESNLCTRNGKRKVWVTKYKWRCLK